MLRGHHLHERGPRVRDRGRVEELDHPRPSCRRLYRSQVEKRNQEVDPEDARRLSRHLLEHGGRGVAGHDHAQCSGVGHGRGQLRSGDLWHPGLLKRNPAADQAGERRFHAKPPPR